MDRFDYFQTDGDIGGNQDASTPSFWTQHTRMNANTMAEIFHEIVEELPSVFTDTLQEPAANVIASPSDDAGPVPNVSEGTGSPGDESNGAMQFANNHPSKSFHPNPRFPVH
jgi:hypothetical protein